MNDPLKLLEYYENNDVGLDPDDKRPTEEEMEAADRDVSPRWLWVRLLADEACQYRSECWSDAGLRAKHLRSTENGTPEPANDRKRVPRKRRARPPGAMLTSTQVGDLLNVARSTVEGIPASELPYIHVGKGKQRIRRRYRREDVDTYVQRQSNRSAIDEQKKKEEEEAWAQAACSGSRGGKTGTSGSTTPSRTVSTGSRPTPPTKTSLGNAWLKLKGL